MPDELNATCHCISLDEAALARHFAAALLREGSLPQLLVGREHLFAPYPVFADQAQWDAMQAVICAAHEVMALPAFQAEALGASAWPDQHTLSAMMAFDFHPEPAGAKLIEFAEDIRRQSRGRAAIFQVRLQALHFALQFRIAIAQLVRRLHTVSGD